jgi:ankyrin repeat protein
MATELIDAVKAGNANDVARLVRDNPALLTTRDANGASPLLVAIYHQKPDIANAIANAQGSIDIFEAAALGRADRVAEILRDDPPLASACSPDGFPAVGLAAFFGHLDAVRTLIAAGADIHAAAKNALKVQAIHAAVASKNLDIVRALLEAGADANATQQQGFRPMHEAGASGSRELAELLMKHGADPALTNEAGKDTAAIAREKGHLDFVAWLEERGYRAG